jgi:hypothetical protein
VKQQQRRSLAGLRRIHRAVGEKSVHAGLSFGVGKPPCLSGPLCSACDKSKFSLFKPLLLDVIFHDCKDWGAAEEKPDAFAR